MRSQAASSKAIGGEFPLDALSLVNLPVVGKWEGVPGWEPPEAVYTSSGRSAMIWGLRSLGARPGPIWVPEYICYSVLEALCREGWRPRPYPLKDDLTADLDAWERLWTDGPAGCLLVDFFGFTQPSQVRGFLAGRKAWPVVEDRTHSIWNGSKREGDVVFASLRKWFALPDGGVVRVAAAKSRPALELPDETFVRRRLLALAARHDFLAEDGAPAGSEGYFLGAIEAAEQRLDGDGELRGLSPVSRRILSTQPLPQLVSRRRQNYRRLARALAGSLKVRPLHPELPLESCPLGMPVACRDRDGLRAHLKAERIYCPVHWPCDHWPAGWGTPHALESSRRLLTLPIDQRLEPGDIDRLIHALRDHGI